MKALLLLSFLFVTAEAESAAQRFPRSIELRLRADVKDELEEPCVIGDRQLSFAQQFQVWRRDLNGDGYSEFIVRGYGACLSGAVGNAPLWIFDGKTNQVLLARTTAYTFGFLTSSHNGLPDLKTSIHLSASERELTVHRFDAKRYSEGSCWMLRQGKPSACPPQGQR